MIIINQDSERCMTSYWRTILRWLVNVVPLTPTESRPADVSKGEMNSRRIILWLLILTTWSLFPVLGGAVAQASCGDYLVGQYHVQTMPVLSHRQAERTEPANSPNQSLPCNGPGCQKAPVEPILPAPMKINVSDHDRLGCLMPESPLPPEITATFEIIQQTMLAIGHPLSIEHPPRT